MIKQKYIVRIILIIGALSLLALLFLAALGVFVKPGADDLYYLPYNGNPAYYTFHFLNGRITSILLYGLLYPVPGALQIVPALGIALLLGSFYIFYTAALRPYLRKKIAKEVIFSLSAFSSLISILTLPGIYSSFYWFAAAPVHTWSIACALLFLGVTIRLVRSTQLRWWHLCLYGLGSVIAGCLAELGAAALFAIACGTLLLGILRKRRSALIVGLTLLVGALTSLVTLFFSPGAVSRRAHVSDVSNVSLLESLQQLPGALIDNISLLPHYVQNPSLLLIGFLVVATLTLATPLGNLRLKQRSIVCSALFVVLLSIGYSTMNVTVLWLGLHENQPVRSYFSTTLTLTLLSVILGMLAGLSLKQTRHMHKTVFTISASVLILIFGSLNQAFIPTLTSFSSSITQRYEAWNTREATIETTLRKDNCKTKIPALPVRGMWTEGEDSSYWVNGSIATYYHLPCSPAAEKQIPVDIFSPAG